VICGKVYTDYYYVFQRQQYIADYAPEPLTPVCKNCVYKEKFGTKNYRKKIKEGVLDGKKESK
jgi:hypothetical protein